MKNRYLLFLAVILFLNYCSKPEHPQENPVKGSLFIIGGGERPAPMVKEMIRISGTDSSGYIVVLPMASSEPDTSGWYGKKQFTDQGIKDVTIMNILDPARCSVPRLDSIRNASMIYITGGDQSRFMDLVLNTPVHQAIKDAYNNGTLIAGTSAGAAVMSDKMITGNEYKHPEYTGDFRTIEANNIEIKQGLGLMESAIIDQHFVWRMRMNRLITVALEYPGIHCFGIDEATALIVCGGRLHIFGESQVIHVYFYGSSTENKKGLLGGRGLDLNVLLPGDTILMADLI